jgi:hypothetical protein
VSGFAAAGLIAAVLSCLLPQLPFVQSHDKLYQFIGIFFGLTIPIYLWLFEDRRSLWRAVVFLAASAGAYYTAMMAGLFSMSALRWLRLPIPGMSREEVPLMIVGGFVGATTLYLAFTLLYCRGIGAKIFFIGWPLSALLGAVLGLAGYALGTRLGGSGSDRQIYCLYVVWQTAIAVTLGYMSIQAEANNNRHPAAAPH